jgi:hypothetical protein
MVALGDNGESSEGGRQDGMSRQYVSAKRGPGVTSW